MEKIIKVIFVIILVAIISLTCYSVVEKKTDINLSTVQEEVIDKNSIQYTGWLKTQGSQLQNEKGEPIQLRGLSSHGIQWFYDIITYENLQTLKKEWNTNVFRIAMYTDPNSNGYISNSTEIKEKVYNIIEMAIDLDMYVIVDWHILADNNPQIYETQSKEFFNEISNKYNNTPNVIYEICNEPNGYNVTWSNNVKPYAENIIQTIRANSPKSLIIVGTPDWCKDLKNPADDPLNYENIVYACHFYAGSHNESLQSQIDYCLNKNLPVFISECGMTDATGSGIIYEDNFKIWINYINERNLSWLYWSLSNKDEESSILTPDYHTAVNSDTSNSNNNNIETQINTTTNFVDSNSSYLENNTQLQNNNNINNSATSNTINTENSNINEYLTKSGLIIKNILLKY